LLVDLKQVVLQGGHLPPKIKDLLMIFGELVERSTVSQAFQSRGWLS